MSAQKYFLPYFKAYLSCRKVSLINSGHEDGLLNFSHIWHFPTAVSRCLSAWDIALASLFLDLTLFSSGNHRILCVL